MEQQTVQELPVLQFRAKYRTNTGFFLKSTIYAKTYDEAYKYACDAVRYANKQKLGQQQKVVLSVVEVVGA